MELLDLDNDILINRQKLVILKHWSKNCKNKLQGSMRSLKISKGKLMKLPNMDSKDSITQDRRLLIKLRALILGMIQITIQVLIIIFKLEHSINHNLFTLF